MRALFLKPLLDRSKATDRRLVNARTGGVLATTVNGALDSANRRVGLLKRESFPRGEALIIAPTQAIHTFFMKFPIDVIYVARDGTVIKSRENLKPWRVSGAFRAYAVVELPAGTLARTPARPGDILLIE